MPEGLSQPDTQHSLLALLRQSLYCRLAGYEDVNDAEHLCLDPAMRTVVCGRAKDNTAPSSSEMARFETETLSSKEILKHLIDLAVKWIYNRRGTAEQWIKERKSAVKWTKLSCRLFNDNAARVQLFALAYNLANFLRQLVLPKPNQGWTLTTLREKLVKIGAKVVLQVNYMVFQLAEVAVPPPTVRGPCGVNRSAEAGVCFGGGLW